MRGSFSDLIDQLREATGVDASHCYQCGKCSAGCPMGLEMDTAPNVLTRLLQLRLPECEAEVLRSETPWLCASCLTCSTRCPQEVDIARLMDGIREEALKRGEVPRKVRDIIRFHRAFLKTIEKRGRLHELALVRRYKLSTGHFFQDVGMVLPMLIRGKLRFSAPSVKNIASVRGIFERSHPDKRQGERAPNDHARTDEGA